mmetsp:Transcript_14450/g.18973  ORF Transcript_14450/g.18973 Transcript_14450/m.18973 type:complete len:137 (+) Transcript_14450:39-449(+)
MKLYISALSLGFAATFTSFDADAQSRHWQAQTFTQSMDQKGSATGDYTYSGVKVWSTDAESPEIRFGCSERFGLTANITFLPASQADANKGQRLKLRQKNNDAVNRWPRGRARAVDCDQRNSNRADTQRQTRGDDL